MNGIAEWQTFYEIVGSAAGALIGLQFVVMALIADIPGLPTPEAGAAFATPTILHFGAALLLSALAVVPWHSMRILSAAWGLMGLCGLFYSIIVTRRLKIQKSYDPVWVDWIFYSVFPLASYTILACLPILSSTHPELVPFGAGAVAILFLFNGIHNAWDAVTYHVYFQRKQLLKPGDTPGSGE
jgi:hypothetical protein